MTMAWWQLGVLAGLVVALAIGASLLRGRGRNALFLLVAALAGVITWVTIGLMLGAIAPGRTDLMLPAESGLVPLQNEALRQERLLYERLSQRHPESAAKIAEIEKLRASAVEGGLRRNRLMLLLSYFPIHAPRASDAAIRDFASLAIENLQHLLARDPLQCRESATGRNSIVVEELGQRTAASLIEVLNSALVAPQPPPDAAEAIVLRRQLIDAIYASNDPGLVERRLLGNSLDAPAGPYCYTFIRIFQGILALPPEQSGKVLRFYYGQESSRG
jgi:hypothetical protein